MAIPSWLHFSQLSGGTGTTYITVTADTNQTLFERLYQITISGNTQSQDMWLSQSMGEGDVSEPLTLNITSGGYLNWLRSSESEVGAKTLIVSKNQARAETYTSTTAGTHINVSEGDMVILYGNNVGYGTQTGFNTFSGSTAGFTIQGNLMSILDSANYQNMKQIPSPHEYTFNMLFAGCSGLTDATYMLLPATSVTGSYVYRGLFANDVNLESAPKILPARTVGPYVYNNMFYGCANLRNQPKMDYTTQFSTGSCEAMFYGCSSLAIGPIIAAETIPERCCYSMFENCTNLQSVGCLAYNITANNAMTDWVKNVYSSGTLFVSDMAIWETGPSGKPANWEIQYLWIN